MIFPFQIMEMRKEAEQEPLIVPLAVPLIAGPSLLAVLLLFSSTEAGNTLQLRTTAAGKRLKLRAAIGLFAQRTHRHGRDHGQHFPDQVRAYATGG